MVSSDTRALFKDMGSHLAGRVELIDD